MQVRRPRAQQLKAPKKANTTSNILANARPVLKTMQSNEHSPPPVTTNTAKSNQSTFSQLAASASQKMRKGNQDKTATDLDSIEVRDVNNSSKERSLNL